MCDHFWSGCCVLCAVLVQVLNNGSPLRELNELECVEGEVLSNIWYDDRIARINPDTGTVLELIDFSTLDPYVPHRAAPRRTASLVWLIGS